MMFTKSRTRALLWLADRRQQRVAIRESLFKVLQNGNGLADTRFPAAGSKEWLQSASGRSRWGLVRFGIRPLLLVFEIGNGEGERNGFEMGCNYDAMAARG